METKPCKYCGSSAKTYKIFDMYYTQCTGCSRHNPYDYVGINIKNSVIQWNKANNVITKEDLILDKSIPYAFRPKRVKYTYLIDGIFYPSPKYAERALKIVSQGYLNKILNRNNTDKMIIRGHTVIRELRIK